MDAQQSLDEAEDDQELQVEIAIKLEAGEKLATNLREASSLPKGTEAAQLSLKGNRNQHKR